MTFGEILINCCKCNVDPRLRILYGFHGLSISAIDYFLSNDESFGLSVHQMEFGMEGCL